MFGVLKSNRIPDSSTFELDDPMKHIHQVCLSTMCSAELKHMIYEHSNIYIHDALRGGTLNGGF